MVNGVAGVMRATTARMCPCGHGLEACRSPLNHGTVRCAMYFVGVVFLAIAIVIMALAYFAPVIEATDNQIK